jgi:repressor LexA
MTEQQLKLLNYVRAFVAENGYSPSFEEMRAFMGLASKTGIHRLAHALQQRGHVRLIPNARRSIVPVHRAPTPESTILAGKLASALMADHGFDDGDGPIMCATEKELRSSLLAALTR